MSKGPGNPTTVAEAGPVPPAKGVVDNDLIQKLRSGDAEAGKELVKNHCQPLLRYLQKLVRNDQMAEELHQQTWLSVLENIDRFDSAPSGGGFKAWLYRIATNKANDYWRSRGREKSAREGLRLVTDEVVPEAGARLSASEQDLKLRRCIDLLPDNQRQVLLLRYYSGLKFSDIAQTVGCPLNTALGRMHKALLKLRQLMEQ